MATSLISAFVDDASVTALQARVPGANINSGGFAAGSNSPGIGISTVTPGLADSLPNWTLLDQFGNARNAQRGQLIGGTGITSVSDWPNSGGTSGTLPAASIRLIDQADLPTAAQKAADPSIDGRVTLPAPGASLLSLATGWQEQV